MSEIDDLGEERLTGTGRTRQMAVRRNGEHKETTENEKPNCKYGSELACER